MTLPNFLIVGAAKAGTTSLYNYLRQHPQIFMPDFKEPDFFIEGMPRSVKDIKDYEALFAPGAGMKAVGEASTRYLADPDCPQKIFDLLGRIRIIMVLRNPLDMAYSLWGMMSYDYGLETLGFAEALREEDKRMADAEFRRNCGSWPANFFYFNRSLYYEQVRRFIEVFGEESVQVHVFEEFIADPLKTCRETFSFLGVDTSFLPDLEKKNVAGKYRWKALQAFLVRSHPLLQGIYGRMSGRMQNLAYNTVQKVYALNKKPLKRPGLEPGLAREMAAKYEPDIERLERLIGRDLSVWRGTSG